MKKIAKIVLISFVAVMFLGACTVQKTDDDYKGMIKTAVKANKKWSEENQMQSSYYKPKSAKIYQDKKDNEVYYVRFDNGDTALDFWKIKNDKATYLYKLNGNRDSEDEQAMKITKMDQVYHTKNID